MDQPLVKKTSRVQTLDLMRGYFLVSIAINHLNYLNPLSWATARASMHVSSAEGFFFISGIVLGIVRGAKLIGESMKVPAKMLLQRALQLYIVYIISTVLFTLIGWWFYMQNPGLKPGIAPADTPLLTMIWQSLTFQYLYGWLDYLRLYILFMAIAPVVMLALRNGYWWAVIGVSLLIWYYGPSPDYPQSIYTQPYHWQLLFFGGMSVGFYWRQLNEKWQALSTRIRTSIVVTLVSLAVLTFAANFVLAFNYLFGADAVRLLQPIHERTSVYFDKENLLTARLGLFLLWFWASYWLFHTFEKPIKKLFGWLLYPFGTNSLYVYIWSGILLFFIHLYIPNTNFWLNTLPLVGMLLLILLFIKTKFLMKIIPR